MTCEELDELLAAFALSALGSEESDVVRKHLASCRRHDKGLAANLQVVDRLPMLADEREPSPLLRVRVLDAIAAGGRAPTAPSKVAYKAPRIARRQFVPYLVAAALFLGLMGMLGWNLVLQLGRGTNSQTMTATLTGSGGSGELVYSSDHHLGVLRLELPALPAGRAYQAWQIHSTGPVSLGLVSAGEPSAFVADLSNASAVAVTEEPAGGSRQPTSDPVLIAQIQ